MHYAFDSWLQREEPKVGFERYSDDVIVHCVSEQQAKYLRNVIAGRLSKFGLKLHPEKTRIVYCYQEGRDLRTARRAVVAFTFLGYTFMPRYAHNKSGQPATGFLPAVSEAAKKHMASTIRSWKLGRATSLTLGGVATVVNRVVAGWINYYGRFYKSLLIAFLRERLNPHIVKWAQRKFKHLHRSPAKARERLAHIARKYPHLFVHWRHGAMPSGSTTGAV